MRQHRPPTARSRAGSALVRLTALLALATALTSALTTALAVAPAEATGEPTVEVSATDVVLGATYWAGTAQGDLLVTVKNTSAGPVAAEGVVFLPMGARMVASSGTAGCAMGAGLTYRCDLPQTAAVGTVVLRIEVDSEAWRHVPLAGSASVTANDASDGDGFSVLVPPGPPTPGFALNTDDLTIGRPTDDRSVRGSLNVRLSNVTPVIGGAALELITPPGVDISQFSPRCVSHSRLNTNGDRCELGNVEAGQEIRLSFEVLISAQAAAEAPLTGAVFGYLTPQGQGTLTLQAGYRIALAASPSGQASTSTSVSANAEALPSASERTPLQPVRVAEDHAFGNRVSVLSVVGIALGSVAIVGVLVIASLRRRMRDEPEAPYIR